MTDRNQALRDAEAKMVCPSCEGTGVDCYDGNPDRDCQICDGRGTIPAPASADCCVAWEEAAKIAESWAHAEGNDAVPRIAEEIRSRARAACGCGELREALDYLFDTGNGCNGRPRIVDLRFTAFMSAKRPNDEDGGPSDWFTDTKPDIDKLIARMKDRLAALTPSPEGCVVNRFSSRACERGTKGCEVVHTPALKATRRFSLGDRVRKIKGSAWQGRVVGFYATSLTPEGYAVESEREPGSVQIYPVAALEPVLKGDAP